MRNRLGCLALAAALAACATPTDLLDQYEEVPATKVLAAPAPTRAADSEQSQHGRYLVELLGCGSCHTDGALIGDPRRDRLLAGSRIGIAHSNPLTVERPAVVFPSNITPHVGTGIGRLDDVQLRRAIRAGVDRHGIRRMIVMPSTAFARLSEPDLNAIIAYLRSLAPVEHRVPGNVPEGSPTKELYVHFGVYRSRRR